MGEDPEGGRNPPAIFRIAVEGQGYLKVKQSGRCSPAFPPDSVGFVRREDDAPNHKQADAAKCSDY